MKDDLASQSSVLETSDYFFSLEDWYRTELFQTAGDFNE